MLNASQVREITLNKIYDKQITLIEKKLGEQMKDKTNHSFECFIDGELYPEVFQLMIDKGYQINYEIDSDKTIISWR